MARHIRYDAWCESEGRPARRDGIATWTSPRCEPGFRFCDLVASWTANTPRGSWIEVHVQARGEAHWHSLGRWASGPSTAHRSSVVGDSQVDTDTWRPTGGAEAYRIRVNLHPSPAGRLPTLGRIGAVVSAGGVRGTTSSPRRRVERVLDVPRLSQMRYAEVGGRGWCSPASVAMVLSHAGSLPASDSGHVDLRRAAHEVFDPAYAGTGNWSFNSSWAATLTGHAFVTRLHDLRDAERFIDAGLPLIVSVAYPRGALKGAPTHGTDGHLLVVRGFTADGDVVTNDPGAPSDRSVRRTYTRAQLERAWLAGSGGLVYVIHRDHQRLPAGGRGAW